MYNIREMQHSASKGIIQQRKDLTYLLSCVILLIFFSSAISLLNYFSEYNTS